MHDLIGTFGEVLLPIAVVAALGYLLRRGVELDVRSLSRMVIYLLMPCLIFNTLLRAEISGAETVRMIGFMALFSLLMGGVALATGAALRLERTDQSAFLLSTMFMNSGNYGLPLARFAFGEAGFQYAALFYLMQSMLIQTLAVFIAARGHASSKQALLNVLRLPLVYTIIGALVLRWLFGLPGPATPPLLLAVEQGVQLIAAATLPLMLLMLGMQLADAQPVVDGRR